MKSIQKVAAWVLAPIVILAVSGCDQGMVGQEDTSVIGIDNGVIIVDTVSVTATVISKDVAKGKITLASDLGGESTYKVGKDVADISGINIGDRITAVVTEEIAIVVGTVLPDTIKEAGGVVIAPDGSAAGVVVETMKVTGLVTAVDAKKHKVTFTLEDGSSKTVKVNKDVDLTLLPVGETVTVQVGQGLALSIVK